MAHILYAKVQKELAESTHSMNSYTLCRSRACFIDRYFMFKSWQLKRFFFNKNVNDVSNVFFQFLPFFIKCKRSVESLSNEMQNEKRVFKTWQNNIYFCPVFMLYLALVNLFFLCFVHLLSLLFCLCTWVLKVFEIEAKILRACDT